MLNNAQAYNIPDSRIHRDAITLQAAILAAITPDLLQQEQVYLQQTAASRLANPATPAAKITRAHAHTPMQVLPGHTPILLGHTSLLPCRYS